MNNVCGIEIEKASFRYAEAAWSLDVPELRLGDKGLTCIVGPNGAGKSTLLRLAAGILKPDAGCVRLGQKHICDMPRRKVAQHIGFLPQEAPPLFDYSAEAVVRMGRYAHDGWFGESDAESGRAVTKALEAVALQTMRERPLSRLSGGERRRALIAAVLAQNPDILLLDEPTAALDIHQAVAVMRLLESLGNSGQAVVAVTHDLNLASLFSQRLIVLVKGRVIANGTPINVVRDEVLRQAYGHDVLIINHPETGGPLVVARRKAGTSEESEHVC
ncbi:MAG: ABC transporter ATP-binding protein [Kiritimatiellae bacterium]|nr:ABC transporter ATP-binding protein [Kiritimatiellia bacterium]